MIASQRRMHRVFWLAAAPLLLAGLLVLYAVRPERAHTGGDSPGTEARP